MGLQIANIENSNKVLQIQIKNHKVLKEELEKILAIITLPSSVLRSLEDGDFESSQGIANIETAADILRQILQTKLEHGKLMFDFKDCKRCVLSLKNSQLLMQSAVILDKELLILSSASFKRPRIL